MKKILVLLLAVVCGSSSVYAQSAYQLLRTATRINFKAVPYGTISRHLQAPAASQRLASRVAKLTNPSTFSTYFQNRIFKTKAGVVLRPEIHLLTRFEAPVLYHPSSLWGSYRYLRVLTKLSQRPGAVHPKYASEWKHIYQVTSYNGVHHIVNQRTLKSLYHSMRNKAKERKEPFYIRLDEMMREAPASLHPYHGDPKYQEFFHNSARQLELYRKGGVRAIVTDYFVQLNKFHKADSQRVPAISQEIVNNTLLEARLWAETFHLRWK